MAMVRQPAYIIMMALFKLALESRATLRLLAMSVERLAKKFLRRRNVSR